MVTVAGWIASTRAVGLRIAIGPLSANRHLTGRNNIHGELRVEGVRDIPLSMTTT